MNNQAMYEIWAPAGVLWSTWAKPILFAQQYKLLPGPVNQSPDAVTLSPAVTGLESRSAARPALIVNLRGVDSLRVGLELARHGWRPVPLFNGCAGDPRPAVDMRAMVDALPRLTEELQTIEIPWDAPPAFLLDAARCPKLDPGPGDFDNRWLVFPQDFPSRRFLREHGVEGAMLLQQQDLPLQEDLQHVLRRWQEFGLRLEVVDPLDNYANIRALDVPRPGWFRSLAYRTWALLGFRRGSVGGFGALVPIPQSGGG